MSDMDKFLKENTTEVSSDETKDIAKLGEDTAVYFHDDVMCEYKGIEPLLEHLQKTSKNYNIENFFAKTT